MPLTGAGMSLRWAASQASRTRALARCTLGCWSTVVPSVCVWLEASCCCAASSAERAATSALLNEASCARAWSYSSLPTAPDCTSGVRRSRSSLARARAGPGGLSSAARAAVDVFLSAGQVGTGALDVGRAGVDLRLQRAVVRVERAHLAHRLRELRLGLVEGDARVGRVELDERLAGLHVVGVVGVDTENG